MEPPRPLPTGWWLRTVTCVLGSAWLAVGCAHAPKVPAPAAATPPPPLRLVVSFPATTHADAVSGRVLLFLSKSDTREPRLGDGYFDLQPVYALDVTSLAPGDKVEFTPQTFRAPDALAFPLPLDRLDPGIWYVQALIDRDQTARSFNDGPGNLYSRPVRCELRGATGGTIELLADQIVEAKPFQDTEWVKLVDVRSKLLSDFHGRDTRLRAAVIVPSSYASSPETRFPVLYDVPGFGGRHTMASRWINSPAGRKWQKGEVPLQMLRVVLDPDVPLGHSVFANSASNGPVGDALVQELIPEIERRFRAIPESSARFVTGHSSGGWSSLWLQVTYPDFFGGCWSTAPDPVDFRAFQTMNLYEDRNGHWTREGQPRPVGRSRDQVKLVYPTLNHWEHVTGYGGQLDSFDAVFSPRGADGRPRRVMDKLTGAIDREVADYWRRYDIRLILQDNWATLGPKLQGKIHVIGGGWDTFYLDGAVDLLRDFLVTTNHGGYVEILPGDHGSFMTSPVRERIDREIADQFRKRPTSP